MDANDRSRRRARPRAGALPPARDHRLGQRPGTAGRRRRVGRAVDSGCCGLAGNFGFERGHLDVSRACAEQVLLPALREADPKTAVLADGFSCRTQIHELSDRDGIHLAELLAAVLDSDTSPDWPTAQRPTEPPQWARFTATAAPLSQVCR